ncbi:hypothetical protein F4810DRAFT_411342 [Camillea tinctor]|nr:hypothetical protein F4810DRAFT_411342 [Camillea tinctor]
MATMSAMPICCSPPRYSGLISSTRSRAAKWRIGSCSMIALLLLLPVVLASSVCPRAAAKATICLSFASKTCARSISRSRAVERGSGSCLWHAHRSHHRYAFLDQLRKPWHQFLQVYNDMRLPVDEGLHEGKDRRRPLTSRHEIRLPPMVVCVCCQQSSRHGDQV